MPEPRRLRFSLATLLLVTTIAAMGITITLLMREIGPLRAEVKKLREETGKLWIEDEAKIHAIQVPSEEEGAERAYKFRIALPPGRKYKFCYSSTNIPATGLPDSSTKDHILEPREWTVKVAFQPELDQNTGNRLPSATFRLEYGTQAEQHVPGGVIYVGVEQQQIDWLTNKETGGAMFTVDSIPESTISYAITEPVVLYRARAAKISVLGRRADGKPGAYTKNPIPEPCDGFMLWLEPVK